MSITIVRPPALTEAQAKRNVTTAKRLHTRAENVLDATPSGCVHVHDTPSPDWVKAWQAFGRAECRLDAALASLEAIESQKTPERYVGGER